MKRLALVTTVCIVLLPCSTALASPFYPGVVASVVGAASPPPCTVCHETLSGGFGTATRPLAVYLRSRGLVAESESALRSALAAAEGEKHDADGDGVTDIEELRRGTDPDVAATAANVDAVDPPSFGCGNVSGGPPAEGMLAAGLVVLAALAGRRRH